MKKNSDIPLSTKPNLFGPSVLAENLRTPYYPIIREIFQNVIQK